MTSFGVEFLETGEVTLTYGCGGGKWVPPPPHIWY